VLDFGCGVALIANMIGQKEYFGIDFSQEAIEASKRICENPNAQFKVGSVFDVDALPDRTYDTVIALELLEHVSNPESIIERALARCKKRLILTVPRDMRAPSHVKQKWTRQDIHSLIGPPSVLYLFGGENEDWWWIAVKDMEAS
jgi:2-polyprenyl-3-methyl-5-hydroxy-6-metoxy-1,4-benzoquinol methylase